MANEDKKDFNAMLHNSKDMPKIQIVTDTKTIEKFGGSKMYFAPPIDYDGVMKTVPFGKVITVGMIRKYFASKNDADFTDPMTAGIFTNIVAWASEQRTSDETPYWRTLKADGELNEKYPGGIEAQKAKLEAEGHTILHKGRSKLRYFVKDYETALFCLDEAKSENANKQALQESLLRVAQMEQLFDFVTEILQNTPDELQSPLVKEAIQTLSDYYENGEWLHDYELDDQQLLPPDLKRGVLSQDGLYDLLTEIRERFPK